MRIVPTFFWLCLFFFLGRVSYDAVMNRVGVGGQVKPIITNAVSGYPAIPDDFKLLRRDIILLNFFASWCGPCKQEHPMLLQISQNYPVTIIGVVTRDSEPRVQEFLKEFGNPYDYLGIDKSEATTSNFHISGIPESILIHKNGKILARHAGQITDKTIQEKFLPHIMHK
jgi:DsbE subfamily thiol:disulfide oxidoreductase